MLIKIFLFFIVFLGASKCLSTIVGALRKNNQEELAKSLEDVANKFEEKAKDFCREGLNQSKFILKEKTGIFSPELAKYIDAEGENLLNLILPEKYRYNQSFDFKGSYRYIITDDIDHPFQITTLIAQTTEKIIFGKTNELEKAKAIFDWFENNVKYDDVKRNTINQKSNSTYFTSAEMFSQKIGVCGEMVVLYVVMARYAGLSAYFVNVDIDYKQEGVNHACVGLNLEGKDVLIDPAYHTFDIKHIKFCKWTDDYALKVFKQWRNH